MLIDYYVEATDNTGHTFKTDIQHVYVGQATGGGGGGDVVTVLPEPPVAGESVLIQYDPAGRNLQSAATVYLHYGFDGWAPTISLEETLAQVVDYETAQRRDAE